MIGKHSSSSRLFFFNLPPQPLSKPKPLFCLLCGSHFVWAGTCLGRQGYCRAFLPPGDSNRSPFLDSFFRPPNAGSPGHPRKPTPTSPFFWRVRAPVLLGSSPCTPVPFCVSTCPTWFTLLPHVVCHLTFILCSPSPNDTFFRGSGRLRTSFWVDCQPW
jgi:hypothetical protein